MRKLLFRLFFIMIPALIIGSLFCLIDSRLGLVTFIIMTWFGIGMTEARPERGEK